MLDHKFPILGLLMDERLSGYDIRRFFRSRLNVFYRLESGHIYPILTRLEKSGLVLKKRVASRGKRWRHLYAITPAGKKLFLEELRRLPSSWEIRNEFLVRLSCFRYLPKEEVLRQFEAAETEFKTALEGLEATLPMAQVHPDPYMEMVVEAGVVLHRRLLSFVRKCRKRVAQEDFKSFSLDDFSYRRAGIEPPKTIEDVMELIPRMLKAGPEFSAVVQFQISGDGGGSWVQRVEKGRCRTERGEAEEPDVVIRASAETFMQLTRGEITDRTAILLKEFRIEGRFDLLATMLPLYQEGFRRLQAEKAGA